jgi:heterodisulfide reductase subunit B
VNNDDDAGIPTLMDKLLRMLGADMLEHEDMDEVRMELGIDSPVRTNRRPSATQSPASSLSDSDSDAPSTIAQPVF